MAAHATLSPSSAERWLSCPASVRAISLLPPEPEESSSYAAEGTKAHALAEIEASLALGKITSRQRNLRYNRWLKTDPFLSPEDLSEMERHVEDYVAFLLERQGANPNSRVQLEQRMPSGVKGVWGTSDAAIVSPSHVEIVDLKYGAGVPVSAKNNPQLRLYGLGALDTFGDLLGETETVTMTIFQPRLNSVSSETLTAEDLRAWRENVAIPGALATEDPDAPFGPSEEACRWCPVAGLCRARTEKATAVDFGADPDLLSEGELADLLSRSKEIKAWLAAVEETSLNLAYSEGKTIPGWKVVLSGGVRKVVDEPAALEALEAAGFPREQVSTSKIKGIGDLEKILNVGAKRGEKRTLQEVIGEELVSRSPGKPSLVPEEDRRPALNPNSAAAEEFGDG